MVFEPVVDGEVLPGPPWQRVAAGSAAGVDVLVGANRHEYRFLLVPTGVVDQIDTKAVAAVATAYGLPDGALDRFGPRMPDASPGLLLAEVMTDWFYRIPHCGSPSRTPPVASCTSSPGSTAYGGRLGACHGLELPFVFDSLHDPGARAFVGTDPPAELAAAMRRAWTAFATTVIPVGRPTRPTGGPSPGSARHRSRTGRDR